LVALPELQFLGIEILFQKLDRTPKRSATYLSFA
jgi:hypothetical protein